MNKKAINPVKWFEIYVSDMERARKFYESVFDTQLTEMQMQGLEMWGFPYDEASWGCSGALIKMQSVTPSGVSTVVYFGSDDCAIEEQKILEFGGKIHKSKLSIGENGYIVLGIDTEGNMIGIHSNK